MARTRGRSLRGQRCVASVPHGHWETTTFVGGLCHDRLIAPMVADGPMDGEMFLAYVRRVLAPALRSGDIVNRTIRELEDENEELQDRLDEIAGIAAEDDDEEEEGGDDDSAGIVADGHDVEVAGGGHWRGQRGRFSSKKTAIQGCRDWHGTLSDRWG
jgi:hypothetical protein